MLARFSSNIFQLTQTTAKLSLFQFTKICDVSNRKKVDTNPAMRSDSAARGSAIARRARDAAAGGSRTHCLKWSCLRYSLSSSPLSSSLMLAASTART